MSETPKKSESKNTNAGQQADHISDSGVSTYKPDGQIGSANEPVEVDENFKAPNELLQAQSLANLLDMAVKLPFIGIRVGLDFLLGIIPVIGDTAMFLASLRIIYLANKIGVPSKLRNIMIRNCVIDYALGIVPIFGDIADVFFKANLRNVRIMEQWWVKENKAQIDALAKKRLADWKRSQA